jgi:hypothetical protein
MDGNGHRGYRSLLRGRLHGAFCLSDGFTSPAGFKFFTNQHLEF